MYVYVCKLMELEAYLSALMLIVITSSSDVCKNQRKILFGIKIILILIEVLHCETQEQLTRAFIESFSAVYHLLQMPTL